MSTVVKFDSVKSILANSRITQTMIKPFTKIQTSTFSSSRFLIDTARDFFRIDNLPANATDADIMSTYGISPGENADVDPRIALAILINKGNPEATRIINAALREVLLTPAGESSDLKNAVKDQSETKNPGLWLEVKNEPDFSGLNPLLGIPSNGTEPDFSGSKMGESEYFPKGSKITKPIADVRGYLEIAIKKNLSDPLTNSMISVNALVAAAGVNVQLCHWTENTSSKAYINAVMRNTGKTRVEVFQSIPSKGTLVNVLIAIEIARWIDPDFSVMVNDIVLRVMSGDLSLIPQIADHHDKLNGTVTNVISIAAGNENQVRQTTVESSVFDHMTNTEVARQARINAQQESFNHSVWRELNFDLPMNKGMLYERDHMTGRWLISKEPDGRSPKIAVECMLKALKPEAFVNGNITTLYDCIELMWFMIANYENSISAIENANDMRMGESEISDEAHDRIAELEKIIKGLRSQITNVTNAARLRPLIDGIIKARNHGSHHPDLDLNAICNLINTILNGDNVDPSAVMAINWYLTYGLGQDLKSHRDFRNLVAVVNDICDVLRADLESEEYKAAIPKNFGDIFAPADQRGIDTQMPSYWRALSLPEVNAFTCAVADTYSSDRDEPAVEKKESNPENAYAMLTPLVATKKRAAPTRAAVVKKAEALPDELRAALLKNIEDRANSTPMCFMNTIDEYMLHLYIGQLGWAGNIVPKKYTAAPSLVLLISMREILDAGAWHFRPAGQITLIHPMVVGKAIAKLGLATDLHRKPLVQPVNQGAVSMTTAYDSNNGAPYIAVKQMINTIVSGVGKSCISTIMYPDDNFGVTWRMITPNHM